MAKTKKVLREALKYGSYAPIREAQALEPATDGRKRWKCVLLTEGKGNIQDKHYYSQKCIDSPVTAKALNGKPCYIDHPDAIEEQALPERSVEAIGGWWDEVHAEGKALVGILTQTLTESGEFLENFLADCLFYAKSHPGENLGGFSINAGGPTSVVEIDGQQWKQVDAVTEGFSTDLVTLPARGGQVIMAMQSKRNADDARSVSALEIAEAMRDKITAGAVDPKDMRRQIDNLITALNGHAPAKEGEKLKKLTRLQLKEAKKKMGEAMMGEADMQNAAKVLAAYHKSQAEKCEGEGDSTGMAHHTAQMEKYKAAIPQGEGEGEGDEPGSDPGDTIIKKKGAAAGGEDDDSADDTDDDDVDEGEDMAGEGEEEGEDAAGEAEKKEAKKKESLRIAKLTRQNFNLKLEKKLSESGLPEVFHARVRVMAAGKTDKEIDQVIESVVDETEFLGLSESGAGLPAHRTQVAGGDGTKLRESSAVFAKFGFK